MKNSLVWRCQAFVYSADRDAKLEESVQAVAVHANQISQSTEVFVPRSLHRPKSQKPVSLMDRPIEMGSELSHQYTKAFLFLPPWLCTYSSVCSSCCLVAVLPCLPLFQASNSCFVLGQAKPDRTARYSRDKDLKLVQICAYMAAVLEYTP